MEITNLAVEDYLHGLAPSPSDILREMQTYGEERGFPIIGPLVGQMLYQYALLIGAQRILEMGSGFGYSALWFSLALPETGEIHCTEGSKENVSLAKKYLERAGVAKKAHYHVGDALELVDDIPGTFDIILIDINKDQYPAAFHKALPRLNRGGVLITDNMLRSGRVLDKKPDASTRGVLDYTKLIYDAEELVTTLLPLRDGVAISVKR